MMIISMEIQGKLIYFMFMFFILNDFYQQNSIKFLELLGIIF